MNIFSNFILIYKKSCKRFVNKTHMYRVDFNYCLYILDIKNILLSISFIQFQNLKLLLTLGCFTLHSNILHRIGFVKKAIVTPPPENTSKAKLLSHRLIIIVMYLIFNF